MTKYSATPTEQREEEPRDAIRYNGKPTLSSATPSVATPIQEVESGEDGSRDGIRYVAIKPTQSVSTPALYTEYDKRYAMPHYTSWRYPV
jgi:hypothetical protein